MPREVDPRRTRKALRAVRKLAEAGAGEAGVAYSEWEAEFLQELEGRLDQYGSAFADPEKGAREEALSRLQAQKLKEIAAKAKGKPRSGFGARKPPRRRDGGGATADEV